MMEYKSVMFFHLTAQLWMSGMGYCVINIHDTGGFSRDNLLFFKSSGGRAFETLVTSSSKGEGARK